MGDDFAKLWPRATPRPKTAVRRASRLRVVSTSDWGEVSDSFPMDVGCCRTRLEVIQGIQFIGMVEFTPLFTALRKALPMRTWYVRGA